MKAAISCLQNIKGEEIQNAMVAGNVEASSELKLFGKRITQYAWLYVWISLLGKNYWSSQPHCMYLLSMMVHLEPGMGDMSIKVGDTIAFPWDQIKAACVLDWWSHTDGGEVFTGSTVSSWQRQGLERCD